MHFALSTRSLIPALPFSLSSSPSLRNFLVISMAGVAENGFSADAIVVDGEDLKFGFQRPEMNSIKLSGTVDAYDRHLFLCYKTHEDWPAHVENSESYPLPKLLSEALKGRKDDINGKTRLTICEGSDANELSDGDVLIFPEMIKCRGLKDSDVDSFVEDVLVNGKPWASDIKEVLTGFHVFVCAHNSRDKRCGVCGPALIEKFKEEIELKRLKDQVFVSACSHVGGHKYAGNIIIFGAGADGKITGHWYGYVAPSDVPELLDQHIGKGEIIERLWRGQLGAPAEEPVKVDEPKLSNGISLNISEKATPQEIITEERKENVGEKATPQESIAEERKENVVGCCQGANGFSCCQDENSQEKPEKKGLGMCNLSRWTGKWEQREVLTAAAVVGAVTTVVVAYSFYKRSR